MESLSYRVAANGRISVYRGKRKLSAPWEEIPVDLPTRRELRKQIDSRLVKAAWAIFGSRVLPADINELLRFKNVVLQILADSPRLLPAIYFAVQEGYLRPTPAHSVVKRFKQLLMREGYQPMKRSPSGGFYGGLAEDGKKRKDSDVNNLWGHFGDKEALTDAGWRYLCKLSFATLQKLGEQPYYWQDKLPMLNLLGSLGMAPLPDDALRVMQILTRASGHMVPEETVKSITLAMRDLYVKGGQVTREDVELVRDWIYGLEDALIVNPGTCWDTILERAVTFALEKAEEARSDMEGYRWTPPIEAFVANEGLVVTPLSSGVDMLTEGAEMHNCLRSMDSYARRAVEGESQVFRIQGVAGRATAEFVRVKNSNIWQREQAVERFNRPLGNQALKRAVDMIERRLNGEGK